MFTTSTATTDVMSLNQVRTCIVHYHCARQGYPLNSPNRGAMEWALSTDLARAIAACKAPGDSL